MPNHIADEPNAELLERSVRSLRFRYGIALSVLALLIVLAGSSMYRVTVRHDAINAHIMHVVGRQRMLSQRLCKAALTLVTDRVAGARQAYRAEIQTALVDWQHSHASILQTDLVLEARSGQRPILSAHFNALEPQYAAMVKAATHLLQVTEKEASEALVWEDVELLLLHERSYLSIMEQITQSFVQESSAREKQARRVLIGVSLGLLLTLFLEGALVFRPALRQLADAISKAAQAWGQVSHRKQELLTLIGALPDLLLRYTPTGEYLGSFSDQPEEAARLLDRVTDWSIQKLMPPAQAAECLERFQQVLLRGGATRFECMLVVDENRCHVEMRIFSLQPSEVLVLVRDVSAQRNIERRILEAVDQEQQRMGRELHDGLCQDLSGITMMLRSGVQKLRRGEAVKEELFTTLEQFAEQANTDVRQAVRGLIPVELDSCGLAFSLSKMVERLAAVSGVEYDCDIALDGYEPSRAEALHLYRIAQEAVSNALRHGAPSHISVSLLCEPGEGEGGAVNSYELVLKIYDNGTGLPQRGDSVEGQGSRLGGLGLRTMAYRAQSIGAWLRVNRGESGGTLVSCRLPLTPVPSPHSEPAHMGRNGHTHAVLRIAPQIKADAATAGRNP